MTEKTCTMNDDVLERFLRYVKIETTSNEESKTTPSTAEQFVLAKLLKKECEEIGLKDVVVDEHAYVYATLPSNVESDKVPTIGFIAHMDTSPEASGKNVKPRIVEKYDGGEIVLDKEKNISLTPKDFPDLKKYVGHDIVCTDGTTLLGADDKAGIAAIMTAMKYLVDHPKIKHGKVRIAFTPDEEIGRSADKFDVKNFGCKWAYTLDGGLLGEVEYETFNACSAFVEIKGRNVHPGEAKDKMCNALNVAIDFHNGIPRLDRPEHTEKREGYFHLMKMKGSIESASLFYIIRDHDSNVFEWRKNAMKRLEEAMNKKYGRFGGSVKVKLKDSYKNMGEKILPVYDPVVTIALESMKELKIKPIIKPVRGGTDGARLSFMGLPCPNLFAGGGNFHSRFEFLSVQALQKAKDLTIRIIENYEKRFGK